MRLFVIPLLMLTGCATSVPVKMSFPEAPTVLMEKCPELKALSEDAKLSDVAKTVAINYTTYYQKPHTPHNNPFLYNDVGKQILEHIYSGYNSTVFAYGQTGAGKSYSI